MELYVILVAVIGFLLISLIGVKSRRLHKDLQDLELQARRNRDELAALKVLRINDHRLDLFEQFVRPELHASYDESLDLVSYTVKYRVLDFIYHSSICIGSDVSLRQYYTRGESTGGFKTKQEALEYMSEKEGDNKKALENARISKHNWSNILSYTHFKKNYPDLVS